MKIFTVLGLALAIFAVSFAAQNSEVVAINFLGVSYQASMGLTSLLIFSAGTIFGLLISVPPMVGRVRRISSLNRRVEEQSREIELLNRNLNQSPENESPPQPLRQSWE